MASCRLYFGYLRTRWECFLEARIEDISNKPQTEMGMNKQN